MSQISSNPARANAAAAPTPVVKAPSGALDLGKLEPSAQASLSPDALKLAAVSTELPAVAQGFSAPEKETLAKLGEAARKVAFADLPADPDAARAAIAKRLTDYASSRVPGKGAAFEGGWKLADAAVAAETLDDMTVADRARLEGVVFKRAGKAKVDDALQGRDSDGLASISATDGKQWGLLGGVARKLVAFLQKFAPSIAAFLVGWFPHALEQHRNREIMLGDNDPKTMREVLTHEIGHQVQFGPDPDIADIKEWGKLSGWMDGQSPALGIDHDGNLLNFDPSIRPTRSDNFVYDDFGQGIDQQALKEFADDLKDPEMKARFQDAASVAKTLEEAIEATFGVKARGYSMTSPLEDFAESYRAFQNDPDQLVAKAPDKFLFINANSRKYTPEQVAERFKAAGVDLRATATKLASVGLNQDTLDRINKANGLTADVKALGAQAAEMLKKSDVPAFQQVYLKLQTGVAQKDNGFLVKFLTEPDAAMGDTWHALSPEEQAQFASAEQRQDLVTKLQKGQASYASASSEGLKSIHVKALQSLASALIDRADFRDALAKDPEQALASNPAFAQLPPSVRKALLDPDTRKNLPAFSKELNAILKGDGTWLMGDSEVRKRMQKAIAGMNDESLTVALALLHKDPDNAARSLLGINVGLSADAPAA